ncbi:MAG: acyl-CoA dehydrogenase [Acidobacteriota bacterium]
MTSDRLAILDDPHLFSFMPMLYVAWSDGELSDVEMTAICQHVSRTAELPEPCTHLLGRWLDPADPPSARELETLVKTIRTRAADLPNRDKLSLTGLGLALAQSDHDASETERTALYEVEKALGVIGTEAARHMLASRRPAVPHEPIEPTFDFEALRALLDQPNADVRERIYAIIERPDFDLDRVRDVTVDDYREQVFQWLKVVADEGIGALSFSSQHGGGDSQGGFVTAFETLASFNLSLLVKFGVQFGLFGGSIQQLGTERHHAEYLPDVGSLELPGCFAMTETGHGSNVADLETTATWDGERGGFIVDTPPGRAGWKNYIGNAARDGQLATVFAQLEVGDEEHGVHAFLVPIRDKEGNVLPGISVEDDGKKMGLNGVDNGKLRFDNVFIPRTSLLDRFASVSPDGVYSSPIPSRNRRFFTMLGTLVGGRVSVALAGLTSAKVALTIAVRYAERRRQFGPPDAPEYALLDYLTHRRRLLPRLAKTYALHFALRHLAERYIDDSGDDRRDVEALAAGLKALATWHATDTIQECREACGGQGYLAVNRFADLKADSDIFTTFEGDNVVLLQLTAKSLLTDYRNHFHDVGVFGIARFFAGRALTSMAERNPIATRLTGEKHLRDRDFHLAAFTWREQHLVGTLASRIKSRIDQGIDSSVAILEVQDHMLLAARAHIQRIILEQFLAAIERVEDDTLRGVLDLLCDLHALDELENDRGWFLDHGYLEPSKSKAIRDQVNELCDELRPHAEPLVNAFGIPKKCLGPIAW